MSQLLKIGTRGSPLALWQAEKVASLLQNTWPELSCEIVPIKTTGDRIQDRPLNEVGGKGLFVKEIEEALLDRSVDIAVHSMKDVPAFLPDGLTMGAVLERAEYRDALIAKTGTWETLPQKAIIGTSSLRRRVQAANARPDLQFRDCRGNVDTRLRKLEDGQYDAIVLSAAGLHRLGFEHRIAQYLNWIPAVGQGVIGIECRQADHSIRQLLDAIDHFETAVALKAERAFMQALEGNCQVALGCLATLQADQLSVHGFWLNPKTMIYSDHTLVGPSASAAELGLKLAEYLRSHS